MHSRCTVCAVIVAALVTMACEGSTMPARDATLQPSPINQPQLTAINTSASTQPTVLSGTVWLHTGAGVQPYSDAKVWGWADFGNYGHRVGPVTTDANGRYAFSVVAGMLLRVQVAATYQPCVTDVPITGNGTRDVHVIRDSTQLGANLPTELLAEIPQLSGRVFEIAKDGVRQPVAQARVELDMLDGMGDVSATTLTDAQGQYVFCGLAGHTSTYVYASKPGYLLADVGTVALNGDTARDIELKR